MSDNTQFFGAAASLGIVGAIVLAYMHKSESSLPLPPSPPTWRLRGHFIPPRNAFLTIEKWIEEYGPLITIRSGPEKIVIIGRHQAAMDIMEKQGASLTDRPRMIAAGEMLSGGLAIGLTHAGNKLRQMRRVLHTHLQPRAAEAYQPLQMSLAKNVVLDILEDPSNFQDHAAVYTATTMMKVAYGKNTPTSATDPEIRSVRQRFEKLHITLRPGAYLVDSIPWLKYLPWYGRDLRQEFEMSRRLYTNQLSRVQQQMQSNVDTGPSFTKHMLEHDDVHGLTEVDMAFLAGSFFSAGSHSTATTICTVFMAAVCFPEEQAKVQAELDAVIGRHRAPTLADEQSLPRLRAFIAEALRWRPFAANGLAHRTTKDVIWGNYCIPAGTTVFGSHWAISRDPEVYPDPHAFKPERWINDQGGLKDDHTFYIYGFGRRVCPGQAPHFDWNRSVFITSLLVLWAFQLTLDPTKPLDDLGYISGLPPKFKPCSIEFKTKIPEAELRRMMEKYPETDS
ncbi:cytochrome P450 [Suillus lakei]|nr:cytochrome P450 [Suillus lakei]